MRNIFGQRWAVNLPTEKAAIEDMMQTWEQGLAGINAQQIARGLSRCVEGKLEWPPTLPEFRAMCVRDDTRIATGAHRLALPAPPVPKEHREAILRRFMPEIRGKIQPTGGAA